MVYLVEGCCPCLHYLPSQAVTSVVTDSIHSICCSLSLRCHKNTQNKNPCHISLYLHVVLTNQAGKYVCVMVMASEYGSQWGGSIRVVDPVLAIQQVTSHINSSKHRVHVNILIHLNTVYR